ncbi:HEPN domain-containing protein [Desulfofundulus thermocisternus]|uniref:HEPN domain-containing protein n=1 Tax=Desulfofundulus thermocisternus TaxID=42471 RepID=UPI00068C5E82|nr:HEPN domain-containing protein [Desulfofundulus thermocisternus]
MPERKMDWMKQAQRDLLHAKMDLKEGFYEWACFSAAQQAAEKAAAKVSQPSAGMTALEKSHRPGLCASSSHQHRVPA